LLVVDGPEKQWHPGRLGGGEVGQGLRSVRFQFVLQGKADSLGMDRLGNWASYEYLRRSNLLNQPRIKKAAF
jgi:hypothetical protein